jgi:1,4-dihydroxy-2-naphthoate octaprenyltransferase
MGFLAFLLIGGASGAAAWIFYPGSPKKHPQTLNLRGLLVGVFLGFTAASLSSYVGQYLNLFQSGQMLEWAGAILASCAIGCVYTALVK